MNNTYTLNKNIDERNLMKARAKAREFGLNWQSLDISNRKNKRFQIRNDENKIIHFGLWPYKEGTYIDHHDENKRINWKRRHIEVLKDGVPAFMNENSPEFYSWNILWD